jgi:hypothetical protein
MFIESFTFSRPSRLPPGIIFAAVLWEVGRLRLPLLSRAPASPPSWKSRVDGDRDLVGGVAEEMWLQTDAVESR